MQFGTKEDTRNLQVIQEEGTVCPNILTYHGYTNIMS